jgi:hypothetical protein
MVESGPVSAGAWIGTMWKYGMLLWCASSLWIKQWKILRWVGVFLQ